MPDILYNLDYWNVCVSRQWKRRMWRISRIQSKWTDGWQGWIISTKQERGFRKDYKNEKKKLGKCKENQWRSLTIYRGEGKILYGWAQYIPLNLIFCERRAVLEAIFPFTQPSFFISQFIFFFFYWKNFIKIPCHTFLGLKIQNCWKNGNLFQIGIFKMAICFNLEFLWYSTYEIGILCYWFQLFLIAHVFNNGYCYVKDGVCVFICIARTFSGSVN